MEEHSFDTMNKSARLRDILQQTITDGVLKPGDRLPSEPELAARYKVSRSTVREAITALAHEGRILRLHGKGNFIAEAKPAHQTFALMLPYLFFSDAIDAQPFGAGTDVFPRLMQSIEGEARRANANILLYLNNWLPTMERENIENVLQRQVNGVLLNYVGDETNYDAVERLRASEIPLVLIDRYLDEMPVDTVVTDNILGAYRATRLLIAEGFGRVIHVTNPSEHSAVRDRRIGYEKAIREAGSEPQIFTVAERQVDKTGADRVSEEERAYHLALELLAADDFPIAVFAAEAPILAGMWRALQEKGLPHDRMALACFDEHFIVFPPTVFSVKVIQPFAEIGRRSVAILQERIAKSGPAEPYRIFLEPEVVASKV